MAFKADVEELKSGLIIFRRTDVDHKNWYCRIKVPNERRYKTISLKTDNKHEAREKAFDHESDVRFRVRHEIPVFDKTFAQVAEEYYEHLKTVYLTGQITKGRWQIVGSYIRLHLSPFIGNEQVAHVGEKHWSAYPLWRKNEGGNVITKKDEDGNTAQTIVPAKDGAVRQEMMTFRAIMNFAADRKYIRERQVPRGKLPSNKARREEFTPQEYKKLHTDARAWMKKAKQGRHVWYRTMAYNFMLIMANTGMRTIEASNLRWRDIDIRTDKHGRPFVCLNVRGKDKYRELIAAHNVAEYLDRIRKISKATKPDDFVFTTDRGEAAQTLYNELIADVLKYSGLLISSSGSRRSSYCFRHTYATFRLMEGVDVYFLAKQMGTSVKMIEDHYGHITPAKNAERILQGVPGWEPIADGPGEGTGSVNAVGAGTKPAKPRKK